ncbi:glycosyltransferase family 2 protein [Mesorhizobium sp. KR1-2]|uniref:glycosyltransferase family 2 protein n=1 Tax=Mesorhizobium sp. KR1-2 TaxID=3156609 RepID=UPI0032B36CEA
MDLSDAEENRHSPIGQGRGADHSGAMHAARQTSSFPDLAEWQPILARLGLSPDAALRFANQAQVNGTDFQSELLASGEVEEEDFFRALAQELGLPFVDEIDPDKLIMRQAHCLALLRKRGGYQPVKVEEASGISYLIAPERTGVAQMLELLARYPGARRRLKMTTPRALRRAVLARASLSLVHIASRGLFEQYPEYSARIVANAWQGTAWGAALVALLIAVTLIPETVYGILHCALSLFFLACVCLRFAALQSAMPPRPSVVIPPVAHDMPVYSILVALYDEAEMVPGLFQALGRIVWPKSKLEIKLVCEADDLPTLAAIRACKLPPFVEIVETPPAGPRTKPKALAYALPITSGEFVVLFDAEDHPHPSQLLQAWQRFRVGGEDLACLQAPLEISNRDRSLLSRMFFFEYAALFRGLLPWLARYKLLLPLGGTSNHFRREALERLGGWDPHNVTEDADLGVRLTRFGYRAETISLPTLEDAPEDFRTWLPQRTRWFKGWFQTWLVHMRNPPRLARDLGFGSFVIAQILFAGMIVSATAHPFLIAMVASVLIDMATSAPLGLMESIFLPLDMVNIAGSYLSFLVLGCRTLKVSERTGVCKVVLFMPVYWMMISLAAWRSLWQLWLRPHHWEKTAHRRAAPAPAHVPRRFKPTMKGPTTTSSGIWALRR